MGRVDASPLSPSSFEHSQELAELRRRAYGPNADIGQEVPAQRRLRELEADERSHHDVPASHRPPAAVPVPAADMPQSTSGFAHDRPHVHSPAPAELAPDGGTGDENAAALAGSRSRGDARPVRRRIPLWAVAAVAGVVAGVTIGVLVPTDSAPPPDLTLRIAAEGGPRGAGFEGNLDYWGIATDDLRAHEPFDVIDVWTAERSDGSRCVVLSYEGEFLSASCAGTDLMPVLDFTVYDGMSLALEDPLEVGTVIRFVGGAADSDVQVWVRAPQGDPAASSSSASRPRPA